jgi:hypothetical protein
MWAVPGYASCVPAGTCLPDVLNVPGQLAEGAAYEHSPNDTRTGSRVGRATPTIMQLLESTGPQTSGAG